MSLKIALFALALAQLPAPVKLSDADPDTRLFRAEIARIEKLLNSAPDQAAVTYALARTWAAGKQWPEAIEWLRKAAEMKAGLDPSRDSIFAALRGTREFEEILSTVREATPPVIRSHLAFDIPEGDLVPESVAYDPKDHRFYFGSIRKGKLIRCAASGHCEDFISGLGVVLGVKVRGDGLWLLDNSPRASALIHCDLRSPRVIRKFTVTGGAHNFNDLVLASEESVYLTDTPAGAVWHLNRGNLEKMPGQFENANGIALSPDGRLLYVSTFPDGITVVDLKTHRIAPIARPPGLCLVLIDGLYFDQGALIAIQNGFMSPRVVRLPLTRDLRGIERLDILERRNPLFDGVTTGVVVGTNFFFMANIQDDKKSGFHPITILRCPLDD